MFPNIFTNDWILIVVLTAGFGGFVHGILRRKPIRYTLVWPFSHRAAEFGFLGDIFVGVAAGVAILFVVDSVFGLKPDKPDDLTNLKIVALGVICGYLGSDLLSRLALLVFKSTIKDEQDVEKAQAELEELKERTKAASKAADLMALGDAYWRWGKDKGDGMFDRALELFDEAIRTDPKNPNHYIKKSFVYASKAEGEKDKKTKRTLYETAIALTDQAIRLDESSARAYYDRACYKHLIGGDRDALHDLATAIKNNDTMRKMAKLDPDLESLRDDGDFKKLVDTEIAKSS
jgi:tetratricopeptide (TPR) repeat protein